MLTKGQLLQNRYRVLRLLGEGGMGAVYLAEDANLKGKWIALKENRAGTAYQFQEEAVLLANLNHPGLPRVTDHFMEAGGAQYLVMDFIEGRALGDVVSSAGGLSEKQGLSWFSQILDAVVYLHAHHVLHRDVKPQNIIITPDDKAVLVDFGIAKQNASGQNTSTGLRAASPGFAAPEQYAGGTTERSDIYSLGAVLYFMLTGVYPPESPQRSAGTALIPPRKIKGNLSASTEKTILTAMNLDARQRFASVAQMQLELSGKTQAAAKPTSTAASNKRAWLVLIAVLAVGALAFVGLNFLLQGQRVLSFGAGQETQPTTLPAITAPKTVTPPVATKTVAVVVSTAVPAIHAPTSTLVPSVTVAPTLTEILTPTPTRVVTRSIPTATWTITPEIQIPTDVPPPTKKERPDKPPVEPATPASPAEQPTAKAPAPTEQPTKPPKPTKEPTIKP